MRRALPFVPSVGAPRLRGPLATLFTLAAALAAAPAWADDGDAVRVGEVSASAPADARLVRSSMEAVLQQARPARPRRRFVVSASLLACDERRCVVSATLRDERGGNVIATVRGSASSDVPARREGLLKAAAEGAGRQVPRALP